MNEEKLKENSERFIKKSIDKRYVEYARAKLDSILLPTFRKKGAREVKKLNVLEKLRKIVEVFCGSLGGNAIFEFCKIYICM